MKRNWKALAPLLWRGLFCVFFLLGWSGLGGLALRAEDAHELLHLVEPRRKVCCGYGAISECLDDLQLLDEEVVERVNLGPVVFGLEPHHVRTPLLGGIQVVLPVGYGSFQGKLPEMPDVGGLGVESMPLGISNALPPTVEEDRKRTDNRTANHASARSDDRNILYVFLFLWGHEWWQLVLWWGVIAFVVIVHIDFIFGSIYEWKISSQNATGHSPGGEKSPTNQ